MSYYRDRRKILGVDGTYEELVRGTLILTGRAVRRIGPALARLRQTIAARLFGPAGIKANDQGDETGDPSQLSATEPDNGSDEAAALEYHRRALEYLDTRESMEARGLLYRAPSIVAPPRPVVEAGRPLPHCLRTTGALTTPITSPSVAFSASTRKVMGSDGYTTASEYVCSPMQLLDLLDVLTRPDFAASRWPDVKAAGRWARRWGHEALNSEPRGDAALKDLASRKILCPTYQGSMKKYVLDERNIALARFYDDFQFTVAEETSPCEARPCET
jgi:hypothetical protein